MLCGLRIDINLLVAKPAKIEFGGFWLQPGKMYGKKSELINNLNRLSPADDITGLEVWKGLKVNVDDGFVTLSGRYIRDESEIYSFRNVFQGSAKLKK